MNATARPDSGSPQTEPGNKPLATEAWPTRNQAAKLLFAMVLLGIGIDLFFFNGFYASDDRAYFSAAALVASEGILAENPRIGHERLTILGWNIFAGWLSGFNIQAMSASYTFFHAALIVLTYLLAARTFNRLAGVLAAYTTATFPLFIIFSTGIFPDLPIACLFTLALLAFVHAYDLRPRGKFLTALLMMFASGACVGFAYMAKEVGLVVLPVFFMMWLLTEWKRRPRADAKGQVAPQATPGGPSSRDGGSGKWVLHGLVTGAFFAIGFFATIGFEYGMLSHLTGRSYVRIFEREKEEDLEKIDNFHRDGGYNPIARFKAAGRELGHGHLPENLKYLLGAAVIVYPFIRRKNWSVYFLGIWIFAFLTVGTYSIKHYYPPRLQARYYIPAFPFLITVFAVTLAWALGHLRNMKLGDRPHRWLSRLIIVAIILTPLGYFRGIDRWSGNLYRTDFVKNMARAVNEAAFEGAQNIVICQYFTYRICQLWYRGMPEKPNARRPSNVVVSSELLEIDFDAMLQQGGFYYIDRPLVTETPETHSPVETFDALFHPALANGLPVRRWNGSRRGPPPIDARFFAGVEKGSLGIIDVRGYELAPELRATYQHVFKSRSAEILCQLTGRQGIEDRFFSRASRPVLRYYVAADPIDYTLEHENNLLDFAAWSLADPSSAQIERGENNSFVLRLNAADSGPIEFKPNVGRSIPAEFRLPADRRFWLTFEIEGEDSTQIEVELEFFADTNASMPLSSRRIKLTAGRNEIGLYTGDRDRYLLPSIQVAGGGEIRLMKFTIETCRFVTKTESSAPVD